MTNYAATKPAARRLTDAITALGDNQIAWHEGRCVRQDSIYQRLKDSMTGRTAGGRSAVASRASLRIDVLTLITEIDHTTATWNDTHDLTPKALRELAARMWTPEETEKVEAVADTIEKWIAAAAQILNDARSSISPPRCTARTTCESVRIVSA